MKFKHCLLNKCLNYYHLYMHVYFLPMFFPIPSMRKSRSRKSNLRSMSIFDDFSTSTPCLDMTSFEMALQLKNSFCFDLRWRHRNEVLTCSRIYYSLHLKIGGWTCFHVHFYYLQIAK